MVGSVLGMTDSMLVALTLMIWNGCCKIQEGSKEDKAEDSFCCHITSFEIFPSKYFFQNTSFKILPSKYFLQEDLLLAVLDTLSHSPQFSHTLSRRYKG